MKLIPLLLFASALLLSAKQPNIIFVLYDDLGYGDLRAYNPESKVPTPQLDRLAAEGMRFTDAHSGSAVCTPTRYGVVTGRYAWRSRLKRGVLNGYSEHLIEPERATVASVLKNAGYHTACIGKWHLGMDFPKTGKTVNYKGEITNGPNANGFDYYFGISASLDMPPYVMIENNRFTELATREYPGSPFPNYSRKGEQGETFKHIDALDELARRATAYIQQQSKQDTPFFLYLPLPAPHKPVLPAVRFKGKSAIGDYGDFLMQADWIFGEIDKALKATGAYNNTLVMISSDNGSFMYNLNSPECPKHLAKKAVNGTDHLTTPSIQGYASATHRANGPLKGTKADIWEAGHRVPFIARWPNAIKPGSLCDETICLVDLAATCAQAASAKIPKGAAEDSHNILPLMTGDPQAWKRAPVIHHSVNGTFAIRDGKWKLIIGSGSGGRGRPGSKPGDGGIQLYNMSQDPGEKTNLKHSHPEVVERLKTRLREIQRPAVP